jgi:hypothetical protein
MERDELDEMLAGLPRPRSGKDLVASALAVAGRGRRRPAVVLQPSFVSAAAAAIAICAGLVLWNQAGRRPDAVPQDEIAGTAALDQRIEYVRTRVAALYPARAAWERSSDYDFFRRDTRLGKRVGRMRERVRRLREDLGEVADGSVLFDDASTGVPNLAVKERPRGMDVPERRLG